MRWPAPDWPRPIARPDKQARARQGRCGARSRWSTRWRPTGWTPRRRRPLFQDLEADIVRNAILDTGMRIDGRDTRTVRPIIAEVGILPRAHGSALFTRGETQAFCVATLGTGQDEQIIDALEGEYREHFMLHYNFPPYSVGEAGRMGSPGPARGRPRQAGLAGDPSAAAGEGQVPLHAARRLGDHREQRLAPRWPRSAAARSR